MLKLEVIGREFKTRREAREYLGGLSHPSKMPCPSYGISAEKCKLGSLLRNVEGSVCSMCYAEKGCYTFKSTREAHARRWDVLERTMREGSWTTWKHAVVKAIEGQRWFRWHDSGDLQSLEHLRAIDDIARMMPDCSFWLPTKETHLVQKFLETGEFAPNLNVRLSAPMIGKRPVLREGITGSAVEVQDAFQCKAPQQDGFCRDCRACWDRNVDVVSYKAH